MHHRLPRALAVLAAGSLLAPLTTAGPAAAAGEATPPPPRSVADLCVAVPEAATFTDSAGTFAAEIECLATAAITTGGPAGLPADQYGPSLVVRRDSMASFLVRLAETADALDIAGTVAPLPEPGRKSFRDVPAGGIHSVNILRLAEAGIVEGGAGGRGADEYAPTLPVTRAQMASFIVRTLEFVLDEDLTAPEDYFTDDERVAVHQRAINALAKLAIGVGDGKDSFDPVTSIRRGQMAAFLTRALAVLEARDEIIPLPYKVQLLALNDYHGNLEPPSGSGGRVQTGPTPAEGAAPTVDAGGAEFLGTQLAELASRQRDERTITVAAGDLIGASPLLSAAFQDEPSIESLGLAGLQYASVGNHEFDEGAQELLRIQDGGCYDDDCSYRGGEEYDGADFQYLSANAFVTETGQPLLPATAVHELDGPDVGFIGMTLEGTKDIVSQEGVAGLEFKDEVETANKHAKELQDAGVETIVVLLHEGGVQTGEGSWDINGCNGLNGPIVDIANGMSDAIDAVVSGHTHQAYNCEIDGKLVTSAASFGRLVTDIDLAIHPVTGDVFAAAAENTIVTRTLDKDPAQTGLIARYRELLGPIANEVVGNTAQDLKASVQEDLFPNAAARGGTQKGESVLGNLIADAQLADTDGADEGGAVAALMNPGGVRADIASGQITYEDAFTVQPFANNLVTMDLTGAELDCLLEQQFQIGTTLYPSASLRYTVARSGTSPAGDPCLGTRVSGIEIDGQPVLPASTYTITANSFLAGGGDRFSVFNRADNKVTRRIDLDAFVDYLKANDPVTAPALDRITVQ